MWIFSITVKKAAIKGRVKTKSTSLTNSAENKDDGKNNKNLLIAGNDKGGIGKSTTAANVGDGLMALGCKVRLVDGDGTNETLQDLMPGVEQVRYKSEGAMNDFIASLPGHDDDITILDLPGDAGEILAAYFTPARIELLQQHGIRLIVGLTLVQDYDATRGAVIWAETFHHRVDCIGLANGSLTPTEQQFSLDNIDGGDAVAQIIEGRLIVVPKFSDLMLTHFRRYKAVPSAYLHGGRAARELGLNFLDEAPWREHHQAVVASVAAHAVWLIGKPIPNLDAVTAGIGQTSAKPSDVATSLRKAGKK